MNLGWRLVRVLKPPAHQIVRSQGGFGVLEVVVAMGVVVTTLVLLAHTVTVTLSDVGLARQRQGANAIANGTVEQARAIPEQTLRKGLRTSDLAGDPEVVSCAGIYRFRNCSGEVIVHTAGLPEQAPLVPNRTTKTPPGSQTSFNVATYVTVAGADPATDPLRIIVIVSWEQNFRGGVADKVEVETIKHTPSSCVDRATHPFTAPCNSFFFGTASGPKGAIRIEGTITGTPVSATLETTSARADGQLEQVQHIQGAVNGSGLGLSTQSAGNEPASSTADDDPATPGVGEYNSKTLSGGSSSTLQQSVAGIATLQVSRTSGNTGVTTSATAAGRALPPPVGGVQTCPTTTPPGAQTDAAACGHSWSRQEGSLQTQLLLPSLGSLGNVTLASLGAAPGDSSALVDRKLSGTDGTLAVSAVRSFGDLRIGGMPSGLTPPLGWQGYWIRLTPFGDTVSAEVGDATSPPSAAVTTGSLEVWNGSGYTTVSLGGSNPAQVVTNTLDLLDLPIDLNLADVSISGSVSTGAVSTQDPDGGGSGAKRTQAGATSGSPIVADISYNLVVTDLLGAPLLNVSLKISVDLGALFADASYREAARA